MGSSAPSPGSGTALGRFSEAFVLCGPQDSKGRLTEVSVAQLRKGGRDIAKDPNPVTVSFEKLRTRGYVTYLESSLYGQVLTSQLLCPGCSPEDETHKMKLRLLHEFSLWGSGRSDYRELPTTLRYDRTLKRYLMSRFNRTFHLVVHYPGKWGVNQVAIAECKNSEVEACLRNHHSSMVVTEVIRLENANSVNIQNAR